MEPDRRLTTTADVGDAKAACNAARGAAEAIGRRTRLPSGDHVPASGDSAMPTRTPDAPPGANAEDRKYLGRHGSKLSKSTLRAKWTHRAGDEPDRNGQTLATRSPEVIRDWAERRSAVPVAATRGPDGRARTLRFDFRDGGGGRGSDGRGSGSNGGGGRLEPIGWDEWLKVFEERKLVFLYQERRRDGSDSNFFRLDNPTREDG